MRPELSLQTAEKPRASVSTLCAMLENAVAATPDKVALRHLGMALTYRETGRAVAALARRIAAIVAPGEAVALVLPALVSPLYPAVELAPLLREAAPRAILCAPATRDMLADLARDLHIPSAICLGQDMTILELVDEAEASVGLRAATPADPGALLFSGGTTGFPKAVEHTHGRLMVAVRSMQYIWPARAERDVFLPIAPFTHIYGFLQGVLVPVSARGETVIPARFQPERIVE